MRRTQAAERGMAACSKARGSKARDRKPLGRLIVVASSDSGLLDVLMCTVARRMVGSGVIFEQPVTTRALPAGGGAVVSRKAFAASDSKGELALHWRSGCQRLGHHADVVTRLHAGHTVVLGVDPSQTEAACALWADVRVIGLCSRIDRLRSGACARAEPVHVVHDGLGLAQTIRAMSAAIAGFMPQPAGLPPRAGRSAPPPAVPKPRQSGPRRAATSQALGQFGV